MFCSSGRPASSSVAFRCSNDVRAVWDGAHLVHPLSCNIPMEQLSAVADATNIPPHIADLHDGARAWYARTYAHILGLSAQEQEAMREDVQQAVRVFHENVHVLALLIPEVGD